MTRLAPLYHLLFACAMTGCATTVPQPPEKALVAVAVSCLPKELPVRPKLYSDAELTKLDDYQFVLALAVNVDRLTVYSRELEAVLSACK